MLRNVVGLMLVIAAGMILTPLLAQPPAKKGPGGPPVAIQLTPAQQAEVSRLAEQAGEKFAQLRKRELEIVSPQQQGAAEAAKVLARAAGLKGPEERTLIEKAVELTAAQRRDLEQLEQERQQLTESLAADFQKILTLQQRMSIPTKGGMKGPPMLRLPPGVELTDKEQAELAEIVREFELRREALEAHAAEVLTEAQRTSMAEAKLAAKAAGHKGKEEQAAVRAALRLTEKQQAELEALEAEKKALEETVRAKVAKLLEPS